MKTAIIGAGRMGRRHLQVARELDLQVLALCDQNLDALADAGNEYTVQPHLLFPDAEQMLTQTMPECVIVATTAPTHCHYTGLAAETGAKYILCEKPMATSLADCDRMLAVCRQYDARLAINHQMRFMEQYTEPKRIAQSQAFGGMTSVTVIAGNFGMAMNGTHYFEMFRYMTDENPIEVTAWFSEESVPNPRGPHFTDRAGSVRITTASGKRFYLEIGADQGHGVMVVYAGRYGRLVVDELAGTMHLAMRAPEHRALPTTRYGMPWVESTQKIAPADVIAPSRAVLQALLAESDYPTGEQGRQAVAALVAAYESDENGHRSVRLDESDLPRDRVFPWA